MCTKSRRMYGLVYDYIGAMQIMHILELSLSDGGINIASFSFSFDFLGGWLDVQKATA